MSDRLVFQEPDDIRGLAPQATVTVEAEWHTGRYTDPVTGLFHVLVPMDVVATVPSGDSPYRLPPAAEETVLRICREGMERRYPEGEYSIPDDAHLVATEWLPEVNASGWLCLEVRCRLIRSGVTPP